MEQYNQESIKYGVCLLPGRAVSTSTPVSVTIMVCSNWADSFPSCDTWRVIQIKYDDDMVTKDSPFEIRTFASIASPTLMGDFVSKDPQTVE